ncbi:MAG: GlcG protein [Rhizobiales bacterium 62-17]|nr:heme-binding protein [Hyphomicrobiales bacterium]OJY05332.1 MAG: GlcG protein [Rhizobiales bacterium 62-17]
MSDLTLDQAQTIVRDALAHARKGKFNALAIVVLDARGSLKASASEDGTSLMRWKVAFGKAYGAVAWGAGSKRIEKLAADRPHFFGGVAHLAEGGILPVGGGVLIRDKDNRILGAVGVSGDTSDNDELAAATGIAAAGLVADGG